VVLLRLLFWQRRIEYSKIIAFGFCWWREVEPIVNVIFIGVAVKLGLKGVLLEVPATWRYGAWRQRIPRLTESNVRNATWRLKMAEDSTNIHGSQLRISFLLFEFCHCVPVISGHQTHRNGRIESPVLTIPSEPSLVSQKHVCDLDSVSLHPVIASQTLPDILLVDTVHHMCELLNDVFLDTSQTVNYLEIEHFRWCDERGQCPEYGTRRRW
jgi:hypothetical protein